MAANPVKMVLDVLKFLFTPRDTNMMILLILLAETVLVPFIVWKIPYTEIDWKAYMSEVEGFLNGTTDYAQLKGDTGPLVYPAGFVYIYSLFYMITNRGADLPLAQVLFSVLYLLNIGLVLKIYKKIANVVNFPVILLVFLSLTAYRVHSIFVLRLFNDAVAIAILHVSLLLLMENRWTVGCIVYSLSVSVKMNILLYSPGLAFVLLKKGGIKGTLEKIALCAVVQVILGLPFLLTHPLSYIARSFDISRVFLYEWTVNWRLIPESLFVSRYFHTTLLILHMLLLIVFVKTKWLNLMKIKDLLSWKQDGIMIAPQEILYIMFISNFIGMCLSRSLHYQFYVWYFYTLPLILHWTGLHTIISMVMLLGLEYCWNVFPSTFSSSLLLHTNAQMG